jgi:transaldolase
MLSTLDQLKTMTDIVADTGDIEAIKLYQPLDATTNPSLLYKAAQLSQYGDILTQAIQWAKQHSSISAEQINLAMDRFAVMIGCEILSTISGKISTEVDARLSFDTDATIRKARKLIDLYESEGIDKERVLIKIASTWEGIQAARVLQQEGINCNLTLLFSLSQAVACADAGTYLISPFVGRLLEWHKKDSGKTEYAPSEDPGVISVTEIYHYFKQHGISTVVMGASFRNSGEILALSGCDRLTISPDLLSELQQSKESIGRSLSRDNLGDPIEKITLTETDFRYQFNENAMATEKLAEGIRNFIKDQIKLEELIHQH